MDIPGRVSRQIDSTLWTLLRAGREGIDGGAAGQNMVPYGPHLKTTTTAWRSRASNVDQMLYEIRSRVRVGSVPKAGEANLYFLGWTDDVDNPDPEVNPYPTIREFEGGAWEALGLVIGKTCPRNATDPEDGELGSGASPKPPEALKHPNGTPKTRKVTRIGSNTMSIRTFERQKKEANQGVLI